MTHIIEDSLSVAVAIVTRILLDIVVGIDWHLSPGNQ